ncbi:dihydrodipicolinate synthase family protein [Consotaella aegiceratis]|uniref:dihydrodipicolinate synthase family protein n=1 Tax=Consotaella aegiceratis TaxID=3097961 RepID=UPI002F40F245
MSHGDLKGVVAAAITPLDADFEVDVPRLARHVARVLGVGCSFVSTFGTTGEGVSLSTRQKVAALTALRDEGAAMDRQIPAVMTPTLDDAAAMLKAIADLGCRGALVLPPFYYQASEEGIAAFIEAMVERARHPDLDLLLYNIPQLSRVPYTPALIERLIGRFGSRIVGIKDSTGDLENGLMLAGTFPQLSVFTGDDRVLAPLLNGGGAGMIGGMPNLFARDLVAIYDAPDGEGTARRVERQARRIEAVEAYRSQVALKSALAHYVGDEELARMVPPQLALTPEERQNLLAAFQATDFVFDETP